MELTVKLTTEQVIDFIRQMPGEERLAAILALAEESLPGGAERMKSLESNVRELCAERGLDWNTMSDEERQEFINDVIHEDRECAQ